LFWGSWPSEGQALARSFREGVAKGGNGLFEARGTALALAEPSRWLASLHQVRHVRLEHCVGQRLGRRN
jgi:hypothetical protein